MSQDNAKAAMTALAFSGEATIKFEKFRAWYNNDEANDGMWMTAVRVMIMKAMPNTGAKKMSVIAQVVRVSLRPGPTEADLKALRGIFDKIDHDKAGTLDVKKIAAVAKSTGCEMSQDNAKASLIALKFGQDPTISFENFSAWFFGDASQDGVWMTAVRTMMMKVMQGRSKSVSSSLVSAPTPTRGSQDSQQKSTVDGTPAEAALKSPEPGEPKSQVAWSKAFSTKVSDLFDSEKSRRDMIALDAARAQTDLSSTIANKNNAFGKTISLRTGREAVESAEAGAREETFASEADHTQSLRKAFADGVSMLGASKADRDTLYAKIKAELEYLENEKRAILDTDAQTAWTHALKLAKEALVQCKKATNRKNEQSEARETLCCDEVIARESKIEKEAEAELVSLKSSMEDDRLAILMEGRADVVEWSRAKKSKKMQLLEDAASAKGGANVLGSFKCQLIGSVVIAFFSYFFFFDGKNYAYSQNHRGQKPLPTT